MSTDEVDVEPFPYKFQMGPYIHSMSERTASADEPVPPCLAIAVAGDPARKSHNHSNTFDNTASYYCSSPASGKKGFGSDRFPTELCKTIIMKM